MSSPQDKTRDAAEALNSLGQGRDILEFLTSVKQHSDSPEAESGRDLILMHALEHINTAERFMKAIHEGCESNELINAELDPLDPRRWNTQPFTSRRLGAAKSTTNSGMALY